MAGTKTKTRDDIKATETRKSFLESCKEQRKHSKGIDKKSVTIHKGATTTKDGESDGSGSIVASPGAPNDEQLERINKFTRSPKTADELYVFPTLSANTLPDRDDDYFDKATIEEFAALDEPYSSVGKSYMVGHDYTKLPQGRIFGVGTTKTQGATFLTNEVYVPRTASNEAFIDNVEFGVNWAVSVGVLLNAQLCSICDGNQYSFFGMAWCENGHWKGEYYDPDETETDSWGDPVTCDPNDSKAQKAMGVMKGAKDFYELSQVFLGAQYFAALDEKSAAGSKGVVKMLSHKSKSIPVLGLSRKDARDLDLPLQHVDERVSKALVEREVEREDDGTLKWVDDQKLVWQYTPGEEVLCLGKEASGSEEEGDADGGEEADGTTRGAGEVGSDSGEQESEHDRAGDVEEADDVVDLGPGDGARVGEDGSVDDPTQLSADDSEDEPDDADDDPEDDDPEDDDEDEDDSSAEDEQAAAKAAVLAAVMTAKLPARFKEMVVEDAGTGLDVVLRSLSTELKTADKKVKELSPKAELGAQYMKELRAEALDAYVKVKGWGKQKAVDVTPFERILDGCGDNAEQIKLLTEDYKDQYRTLRPSARGVLRSTEPADPNERRDHMHDVVSDTPTVRHTRSGATISRIHG